MKIIDALRSAVEHRARISLDDIDAANLLAEIKRLQAELDALSAQNPVGVFANVNAPDEPPRWEQMVPESWDGKEYIYLYAHPNPYGQEPIAWSTYPPTRHVTCSLSETITWRNKGWDVVPLYPHPVPSAPEKLQHKLGGRSTKFQRGYIEGWNDCIDAMLAAAEGV